MRGKNVSLCLGSRVLDHLHKSVSRAAREMPAAVPGAAGEAGSQREREREEVEERCSKRFKASAVENTLAVKGATHTRY